jgi:hypothetical protein
MPRSLRLVQELINHWAESSKGGTHGRCSVCPGPGRRFAPSAGACRWATGWAVIVGISGYADARASEKLHRITKRIIDGQTLGSADRLSWRERYCVDMRTRTLHGPEDYFGIAPQYRLWTWPKDLNEATSRLNLIPSPRLVGPQ